MRATSQWLQVFYAAVQKSRIAGAEGGCPERGREGASDAWKENWERREEPQKSLGSEGKAAGYLTFILTGWSRLTAL